MRLLIIIDELTGWFLLLVEGFKSWLVPNKDMTVAIAVLCGDTHDLIAVQTDLLKMYFFWIAVACLVELNTFFELFYRLTCLIIT